MKIDPSNAMVGIHGLALFAGLSLEELRAILPDWFQKPLIANDGFETYRLADVEASSHLVFKNGLLWQASICLMTKEDLAGLLGEKSERIRHGKHEAELLHQLGVTSLNFPNGSRVELCFDERTPISSIVITYPTPDSAQPSPRG